VQAFCAKSHESLYHRPEGQCFTDSTDKLTISYGTSPTVCDKIFLGYRDKFSLPNNDNYVLLFSFTFIIPNSLFTGNNKLSFVNPINPITVFCDGFLLTINLTITTLKGL
jgi:hypothetical protein